MHVDGYFFDPENNAALKSCDFNKLRKEKKKQKMIDWEYHPSVLFLQEEHLDPETF